MKAINFLINISIYITMAVIVLMMMLSVVDVTLRYTLSAPITGTMELTELMMICLLLGMAGCAMAKRHVKVDIIIEHVSPKVAALLEIITMIIGFGLCGVLVVQGIMQGLFQLRYQVSSSMLHVSVFPFYIVLAVSFVLLMIAMVVLIVQRIKELASS